MNTNKTYLWWKFLCFIAIINIIVWFIAIWMWSDMQSYSHWQPILSGFYVTTCAFRSFYPRIDVERYCLFDTPFSSIVFGRSSASIAEICFSIQAALFINDLGALLDSSTITIASYSIVPTIIMAQASCWYAILTLNHFWHIIEEVWWTVMVTIAAICLLTGFNELTGAYKILMGIGLFSCAGFAYIVLFVDIPMYLTRAIDGSRSGLIYLSVYEGIQDALSRRVLTDDWSVWKREALWITPYFTVGVWLSIAMVLVNFNT